MTAGRPVATAPLVAAAAKPKRRERKPDAPPGGQDERLRPEILIVDDDPATLVALSSVLEELGGRIVRAASGEEALRCLLRNDFAVILLDVVMPGMDGYQTAELIRRRQRSRHIPIIFLSGVNHDEAHLFRGYSAGAVDYVFKPVEPLVLRSKVGIFVELHRKTEEIRRKARMEQRLLAENLRARNEQMRTLQALEHSKAQQSLIIETLPIALYVAVAGGGFTTRRFVGGRIERLCGFPSESFCRDPGLWLERIDPADREMVLAALRRLPQTGSFTAEYGWECADGSWRYFLDQGVLADPGGGAAPEMFGTWLDVTERRQLEQQLAQAHKMEAIGQLTGGIAHDFNNMLTVIIGSLDRLRRGAAADTAPRIDMALQGALRCADLTGRLLTFARNQPLQRQPLDLNAQIDGLRDLLDRTLGERIRVTLDCAASLWTVSTDPTQIESAVLNLAINARDAMPDGGEVTIATANRVLDERAAGLIGVAAGDYAELSVRDTGTGMDAEAAERAFEPFFTTKAAGKGTGLGLSTIYGFVKQSNGGVSIDSRIGEGTTVRLFLPRLEPPAGGGVAEGADGTDDSADAAGKTVLVVEDEPEVRGMAVAALRELGCEVMEAGDGSEALRLLNRNQEVALLFTDWIMAGDFDGLQLASEARRRRPGLRVLFTSAHGERFLAEPGAADGTFLPKPYRTSDLARAVLTALS